MVLSGTQYLEELASRFKEEADPKNAEQASAYMRHQYRFFGLKSPRRNALFKSHREKYGLPDEWRKTVGKSWEYDEREIQYIGMELAYRCRKNWGREDLALFESMVIQKSWWDTVDYISSNIMGHYLLCFPDLTEEVTKRWNKSDNMWLNRASIIFQLKYKDKTDFELMQNMINRHKSSPEFFLQKAIGWALRQYARQNPQAVRSYVANTELKPLSRREAMKHL